MSRNPTKDYFEDEADRWLRENDPYYMDKSSSKKSMLDYPYETKSQEYYRKKKGREETFTEMINKGACRVKGQIDLIEYKGWLKGGGK